MYIEMYMIRTQIYFDAETHDKLTRLAQLRGEPMAKLVREFVDEKLAQEQHKESAHGLVALAQLADRAGWSSATGDVADRHNEYFIQAWEKEQQQKQQ